MGEFLSGGEEGKERQGSRKKWFWNQEKSFLEPNLVLRTVFRTVLKTTFCVVLKTTFLEPQKPVFRTPKIKDASHEMRFQPFF